MPIKVVVKNQGIADAGQFKLGADFTEAGGDSYAVAFTADTPPSDDLWYPWIDSLAGGAEATVEGKLTFHPETSGDVAGAVTADSCSGDEFMPEFCRVEETVEDNNGSSELAITLP